MDEHEAKPDERLKACPFCGSTTAPFVTKHWNDVACHYDDEWQVVCNFNHGGCGGACGFRKSEAAAIELWNRRSR